MAAVAGLDRLIPGGGRAAMVVLIQQDCDRSAAELLKLCLFWRMTGCVNHNYDLTGSVQLSGIRP